MGCFASKPGVTEPDAAGVTLQKEEAPSDVPGSEGEEKPPLAPLWLPPSKKPPTMEEARKSTMADRGPRLSVKYQSKELSGRITNSRRSSLPFDRSRIGTHTRHGLMPGPRGYNNAKINQDRGVVCWPFNGSYNQALLCVFDGHGSKGEKASEFCMKVPPHRSRLATLGHTVLTRSHGHTSPSPLAEPTCHARRQCPTCSSTTRPRSRRTRTSASRGT